MTATVANAFLATLVATAVGGGCARRVGPDDCARLLDRYVELVERERDPHAPPERVERSRAESRARAARSESFARCPQEVTAAMHACAMAAPNVMAFEQCLL